MFSCITVWINYLKLSKFFHSQKPYHSYHNTFFRHNLLYNINGIEIPQQNIYELANFKMASGAMFAALAFLIAAVSANSTCMWISHQPELPEDVKKLRKF